MKLPHSLTYTTKVKAGSAYTCFVRINPKYKNDKGLHAHEFEHVRQWYQSLVFLIPLQIALCLYDFNFIVFSPLFLMTHNILYKFKKYRLYCEIRAFKKQLAETENPDYKYFSEMLSGNYGLGITPEEAKVLLQGKL